MIPDFKTYIGESVWGDIRRRGLGKETKVEDDINILDGYGLFEYLKKHYDYGSLHNLQYFNDLDQICVCLYEDEAGYYTYLFYSGISDDPDLEISSGVHYLPEDLVDALDKRYTITQDEREDAESYTKIEPKGCRYDRLTNRFFLDVLDFILDQLKDPYVKKKNVSESVWGDIRKRGLGSEVKAEDDVNHMDFDTFADYIKDNYSEKGDWFSVVESDNERSRHIEIDIISGIDLSFNVVDGEIYNILIHNNVNKYIDVPGLKKIFNVNILGSSKFSVVEKDWTKSNNTFVKLIEFFLDKKTTNESVWGDIRKQGLGSEVKEEDNINNLDAEEFVKYLQDTYEVTLDPEFFQIGVWYLGGDSEGIANISIPIEKNDYIETPNMSNRMLMIRKDVQKDEFEIRPNKYVFRLYPNELKKTFGDDFDIDARDFKLIPYSGKITNQVCVDVIDKLLGMVERPILKKKI